MRPNTPSFTTLVQYPKTQSEIRELIDSKEFSLETPLFLAMIPSGYNGASNIWSIVPAIVYNAEQGVCRDSSNGEFTYDENSFCFHAIVLEAKEPNKVFEFPRRIVISGEFRFGQEHISEMFYPVPREINQMLCDCLCPVEMQKEERQYMRKTWGETNLNLMDYVWVALRERKELIRKSLLFESQSLADVEYETEK